MGYYKSLFFICYFLLAQSGYAQSADQRICNKIFSFAFEHKLYSKPIGDVVVAIGKEFLGAPYESHTLDQSDTEHLVINLHSFDCVTFVENVLALARCVKYNRLSYPAFQQELQTMRYRNGAIKGYVSRLHYFSDWIHDNQQKGIITDATESLGGKAVRKTFNFMTRHRQSYPRLSDSSSFSVLKYMEDSLSRCELYFLPGDSVKAAEPRIRNGDIVAIESSLAGLDVSHVGIAVRSDDGSLHYLHAPNEKGNVKITIDPLWAHLRSFHPRAGIVVIRPVNVQSR